MTKSGLFIALTGGAIASFLLYSLVAPSAHCLANGLVAPKILLLGDSITGTVSYRVTVKQALLAKYPGARITTLSYPGKGIAYIRAEGMKHVSWSKPDLVVLLA